MRTSCIIFLIATFLITIILPCPLQANITEHHVPILEKQNKKCHTGAGTIDVPSIFTFEFPSLKSDEESRTEVFHLLYSDIFIPLPDDKPPPFKNH
jgi:hypothetical protein